MELLETSHELASSAHFAILDVISYVALLCNLIFRGFGDGSQNFRRQKGGETEEVLGFSYTF